MRSILDEGNDGETSVLTQTPVNMNFDTSTLPRTHSKSHSVDAHDRRPIQGALTVEGVHRQLDSTLPVRGGRLPTDRNLGVETVAKDEAAKAIAIPITSYDLPTLRKAETIDVSSSLPEEKDHPVFGSPEPDEDAFPPFTRSDLLSHSEALRKVQTMDESGHRGHAHDPLEDHLYLYIGPSTFSGMSQAQEEGQGFASEADDVPIVSESPGAADIDIYETAYRDEIERIRARLLEEGKEGEEAEPVVYLTRRVDAKLIALGGFAGRMMAYGEEGIDRIKEMKSLKEGKARVTGVSRALRAAAREEYERRKQERRARETVETAKAETRPQPSLLATMSSSMTPLAERAWEKGKQARTSFRGLYERARKPPTTEG